MTAMIDMHAHWRPAEVADALRARTKEPRILRNSDGVEVLKAPRMGEAPLTEAFDDVEFHLARMDRQAVEVSVLSLLGSFCWIEAQPLDVSGPLCRCVNDRLSAICQEHPGRFAAFAALPLVDISAAAAELERALGLPGIIGAQIPGNAFLTRKDAEAMRPLFDVANRHRAVLFIHHGPRPGDAFPKVAGDTDNARRRNGTLDMQASLSSAMVTLCLTDYLADYPDATVLHVGCGMDSRVYRLDPPATVDWFDVDYPDVIDLRRQLFPERDGAYHLIGAPLSDLHWLDEVPRDRPGLLIAEGVLHYLSETDVKALLNAVVAHFPSGQMIFDICNPWIVKRAGSNVGGTGAAYKWGLDDPQDIKQLEPKLELIKEFRPSELVAFSRFPLWWRVLYRVQEVNPTLRRMERTIVYRYENASSESRS